MISPRLVTRHECRLVPDPSRVLAMLFVPGHTDHAMREGQVSGVVAHVLDLGDEEVSALLADVVARFGDRHRDVLATFRHHAGRIAGRLPAVELSDERRLLLGAVFTQEYAVEAAAICNPSMVVLPDQGDVATGSVRFAMSVRQIGEGHRSTIGFRTGVVDAQGQVAIDDRSPFTTAASIEPVVLDVAAFDGLDHRHGHDDAEATRWVFDGLGDRFSLVDLEARIVALEAQVDTRHNAVQTAQRLRRLGARCYAAVFPDSSALAERVLHPAVAVEANGMEDARFVRFVEDDGSVAYHATYTGFDGSTLSQQLLTTGDFASFTVTPLLGAAAANKGLALFPRRVGGRYAALSRYDGASNAVAYSDDLRQWPTATPFAPPVEAWESVQVGNCGSPIETEAGWLVLTHGVGPMRTYSIGAWLLDLDEPHRLVGRLRRPLLTPTPAEQDGYVPNVVYSCGGMLHGDALVVPYGIGDASIGFASVALTDLLAEMVSP